MQTSTKQYDIISQGNYTNDKSKILNLSNLQNTVIDEAYPSKTIIPKTAIKKRQRERVWRRDALLEDDRDCMDLLSQQIKSLRSPSLL